MSALPPDTPFLEAGPRRWGDRDFFNAHTLAMSVNILLHKLDLCVSPNSFSDDFTNKLLSGGITLFQHYLVNFLQECIWQLDKYLGSFHFSPRIHYFVIVFKDI